MSKIIKSLKNINWKLFFSLLVMGLIPTIYTTVRVFFIGQLPWGLVFFYCRTAFLGKSDL